MIFSFSKPDLQAPATLKYLNDTTFLVDFNFAQSSNNFSLNKNDFILSTLKHESLLFGEIKNFEKAIINKKVYIGERIRDIIPFNNKYLLFLESSPSIAIFEKQ